MRNNAAYLAACAAMVAGAILPLCAEEAAAVLAHRWSFNGDCSDSVGGVDAVKCGKFRFGFKFVDSPVRMTSPLDLYDHGVVEPLGRIEFRYKGKDI